MLARCYTLGMAARSASAPRTIVGVSPVLPIEALQRKLVSMRNELAQARALLRAVETGVNEVERALAEAASAQAQAADPGRTAPAVAAAQPSTDTAGGLQGARARGESLLQRWVRDGTLIPSAGLSSSWGVSRQALDQAVERGELFSLKIASRRYYLAQLRDVTREQAAEVCRALGILSPGEKLTFWLREHGGLQGRTPVTAIHEGRLDRVAQLAQAWADERVGASGDPASDACA